jgi:hypothetical protein
MNADLQKIIDWHRENSRGLFVLSEAGAARVLRLSGEQDADAYIRSKAARLDHWEELSKNAVPVPRGSKFASNSSFGGTHPRLVPPPASEN